MNGDPPVFTTPLLRELYHHMEWADASVWRAVMGLPSTAPDARLLASLHHLHETQQAFLCVWTDRPVTFGDPDDFPTLDALRTWARPFYGEATRFLAGAHDDALARPCALPWAQHFRQADRQPPAASTLGETLFQVASHSTYHRAQVNTRLRELGGEPPLVDYIAWVWVGKPTADW